MTEYILTNLATGEQHKFNMMVQVEEFLGKSRPYVNNCSKNGLNCFDREKNRYDLLVISDRKKRMTCSSMPQLCCTCKNAYGGCEWSARFEPVKGWTATETILSSGYERLIKSYHITACPKFVEG